MTQFRKLGAFALAATTALVLAVSSEAKTTPTRLTAADGPGFTITLTKAGKLVRTLKHGTYRIVVHDESGIHNFHLTCPGVSKTTGVSGTGTTTWTVKLRKGTYTYVCDPHAQSMRGTFRVT